MASVPSVHPGKKRILLVDDDVSARNAMARLLGELYDVVLAQDGIEGLEMAAKMAPDLIVTDVTMPRLDGVGMVQQLREQQGLKVPVIFLTALDAPRDVIAGIAAGGRHYLTKPVDMADLEKRIARALRF